MAPAEIVQRQVDAYNARNFAEFVATYSERIRIFRMPLPEPLVSGKEELEALYATRVFNNATLRAEILSRIVMGNKVVDHERIRGTDESHVEAVAIYEVSDGLIQCVWLFDFVPNEAR